MKVSELEVPQKEINEELANLKLAIKEGYVSKRNAINRELMAVYGHLQKGGKIVDFFISCSETGLNEKGQPKLAIVQTGAKHCFLYKKPQGGAIFGNSRFDYWESKATKEDVELPPETYEWIDLTQDNRHWKCIAPIIPARVNVAISARIIPYHYYIIYEAEQWVEAKAKTPPRDPILCKRLTKNLFGVLATWDLTPLERRIITGRIR